VQRAGQNATMSKRSAKPPKRLKPVDVESIQQLGQKWQQAQDQIEAVVRGLHDDYLACGKPKIYALYAIDACASIGLPIPPWAAHVFESAFGAWCQGQVPSLDEAFEAPRMRSDPNADLACQVFRRVDERRRKGDSIGEELFEEVAKELGVSSWSQCRKLYYKDKRDRDRMEQLLVHFHRIKRKTV
jgi:hypothetical protein